MGADKLCNNQRAEIQPLLSSARTLNLRTRCPLLPSMQNRYMCTLKKINIYNFSSSLCINIYNSHHERTGILRGLIFTKRLTTRYFRRYAPVVARPEIFSSLQSFAGFLLVSDNSRGKKNKGKKIAKHLIFLSNLLIGEVKRIILWAEHTSIGIVQAFDETGLRTHVLDTLAVSLAIKEDQILFFWGGKLALPLSNVRLTFSVSVSIETKKFSPCKVYI